MAKQTSLPIRVYWGFKRPEIPHGEFLDKLGRIFLPMTIQVMGRRLGALSGYLPVIPPEHQLAGVPNELALVVYKSVAEYEQAGKALEAQAYQLLHDSVFAPPSSSRGFPRLFEETVAADQPYFARSRDDNFQSAAVSFLLGTRKPDQPPDAFLRAIADQVKANRAISEDRQPNVVIFRASQDCLSYWEIWSGRQIPNGDGIVPLRNLVNQLPCGPGAPVRAPENLSSAGHWLHLSPTGENLNFTF